MKPLQDMLLQYVVLKNNRSYDNEHEKIHIQRHLRNTHGSAF